MGPHSLPSRVNYESSSTAEQIAARLRGVKSAVILTHAKPDGDAAGSTLAIARTLLAQGTRTEIWYVGPLPKWLSHIAGNTPRRELAPMVPLTAVDGGSWTSAEPEAIVVVDTGSWPQLAESRPLLEEFPDRVVLIDHHVAGNAEVASRRLIQKTAASATEVLAPVCCALLGLSSAAKLPVDIATPLYLGLATDTGWFRFSSVSPTTLRLAADLKEAGVNHTDLYRLIEQQDTISRWRLLGRSLSSVELHDLGHPAGKFAISVLHISDYLAASADRNDTGGFADMVLAVEEVGASAILTEHEVAPGEPPLTKISIRSKPGAGGTGPFFNAAAITAKMGGGGHVLAAGAKLRVGLDDARRQLLELARAR